VFLINPVFQLVLAGYQSAEAMWYIALIPQALVLCLMYAHMPSGHSIAYKCKEKFVILQSIGIITIKRSETRAVIYTCRYSSGQCNP